MEKYKICPSCGSKNSPTSFDCVSCETDLTAVRVLDEESEKAIKENETRNTEPEIATVRICECGSKNPSGTRKCSACGEDISDIVPTPDTTVTLSADSQKYMLCSIDGEYAYELTETTIIVGRERAMQEYLKNKTYVSRTHAKLTIEENMLLVENLSGTNFTYINNVKIALGEKTKLSDGDELAFGGFVKNGERQKDAAYFLMRIGLCM
jgi:ribosomal protein L40E